MSNSIEPSPPLDPERSPEHRWAVFPYGGSANPYQDEVSGGLRRAGKQVVLLPRGSRLWPWPVAAINKTETTLLDWVHGLFRGRTRLATLMKVPGFALGLALLRTRLIFVIHNVNQHEPAALPRLDHLCEALMVRRSNGFVHFSERARREWNEKHPSASEKPHVVVTQGSYGASYQTNITPAAAKQQLGIAPGQTLVLGFGAVRRYKGFVEFAEAFVNSSPEGSTLLIAGGGPVDVVSELRELAEAHPAHIVFHEGFVPAQDVPLYLAAADIAVAPFRAASNSASVELFKNFGLPVATTDVGGVSSQLGAHASVIWSADAPPPIDRILALSSSKQPPNCLSPDEHDASWDPATREIMALTHRTTSGTPAWRRARRTPMRGR